MRATATLLAALLLHVAGAPDDRCLPPFSFSLGGATVRSTALPAHWVVTAATFAEAGNRSRTDFTATDLGGMQVQIEQTEYAEFPWAKEWLLRFRNDGSAPSPPLCNVTALDTTLLAAELGGNATVHRFEGSHASSTDCMPIIYSVPDLSPAPAPPPGPPAPVPGGARPWRQRYDEEQPAAVVPPRLRQRDASRNIPSVRW